jgi:hypothetical protein
VVAVVIEDGVLRMAMERVIGSYTDMKIKCADLSRRHAIPLESWKGGRDVERNSRVRRKE